MLLTYEEQVSHTFYAKNQNVLNKQTADSI